MSLSDMQNRRIANNKSSGKVSLRNVSRITFGLLFCMVLSIAGNAQDTTNPIHHYQFNLDQCIHYALQHQHDGKNARLNQRYAAEQVKENIGKLLPHAGINGSFVDNLKLTTTLIPDFSSGNLDHKIPVQFGNKYTSSISGQIDQTIFNSNYFIGLKAAKIYEELSSKSLSATEATIRSNVTKAYYNVLVNKEGLSISKSNLDQLTKSLKDIRAKYQVGITETVDVNRIQVQYNSATTGIENQQRLVDYSMAELKFQIGMPQKDSLQLMQTVHDFSAGTHSPEDTSVFSLSDRPEYIVQQTQISLNELNLKSTRLSYLPSLSAYINYGYNYFASRFGNLYQKGYGSSALGLSLSFPLFSGTERIHQTNEARITLEQSRNDLDNLSQQIQLEIKQSYIQYINNRASLKTQQQNMQLTQGVYDRINYKFNQGVASSLDLLSAENELQRAQSNYIDALLNTLMSKVDLEKALGKLNNQQ